MGEDIKVVPKLKIVLIKIRLAIYNLTLGLGIQNKSLCLHNICVYNYFAYINTHT